MAVNELDKKISQSAPTPPLPPATRRRENLSGAVPSTPMTIPHESVDHLSQGGPPEQSQQEQEENDTTMVDSVAQHVQNPSVLELLQARSLHKQLEPHQVHQQCAPSGCEPCRRPCLLTWYLSLSLLNSLLQGGQVPPGGVGILIRQDTPARITQVPELSQWKDIGRVLAVRTTTKAGALVIIATYGFPGFLPMFAENEGMWLRFVPGRHD